MRKVFLAILAASALLTWSCENEELNPEYPFTVVVKMVADSSLAQNVFVEVAAPTAGNVVFIEGSTDENGEVSFRYDRAATLGIRASRGTRPDYTWMGCTEIRLIPNEHITKTVYLEPYDSLLVGCSFD